MKFKGGLGIGDWGLGIGDWNPQSPIPNPQSPINSKSKCKFFKQKLIKVNIKNKILEFNE